MTLVGKLKHVRACKNRQGNYGVLCVLNYAMVLWAKNKCSFITVIEFVNICYNLYL